MIYSFLTSSPSLPNCLSFSLFFFFFKSELICEFIEAIHLALYANIDMWTQHFL